MFCGDTSYVFSIITFHPLEVHGCTFPFKMENLRRNGKEADIIVYFHFTTDITPSLTGFSEWRLLESGADDGLGIEER